MNIKALITTLVLGSSSVAMAKPVTVSGSVGASWSYGNHVPAPAPAPIVRDHRMPAPLPAHQTRYDYNHNEWRSPPIVPVWTTLGTMNRIADGQMSFAVSPYSQFSTLKLQNLKGKSLIYRVQIEFANGRTQVVELNQYLMASNPVISIDLAGRSARSIRNVTVIGRNARMSAYSVQAI
jgi:hypothetical protein